MVGRELNLGVMNKFVEELRAKEVARQAAKTPEQRAQEERERVEGSFDHAFQMHMRKYRTVRESERLKHRIAIEHSQCSHEKPNRGTAVTGTHTATGIVFICQYCLKMWDEAELPPHLRCPREFIGGRVVGVGTAEVSKLFVEQQEELHRLRLQHDEALVTAIEAGDTLRWKSVSNKLVEEPGEIIWNK